MTEGSQPIEVFIYILMEFQSSVDSRMALRFMHYVAGFYSQLIKQQMLKPAQELPPVLPIVLYNGNPRWKAPTEMLDLIHVVPSFLQPYQPKLRYYLVDEGAYSEEALDNITTPISGIFKLENAKNQVEMMQAIDRIVAILLNHPDKERLDRVITRWFKRHLQRLKVGIKLDALNSLIEDKTMLAENMQNWYEQEILASETKGKLEGKLEGKAEMVEKLLLRKFPSAQLSDYRPLLVQASSTQLEALLFQIASANTLSEALNLNP